MSLVARFVVGGIEIVDAALEAGVHDGEVLIGESNVYHHVGAMTAEELAQFGYRVGVDAVGGNVGLSDGLGQRVALGLIARGNHDFGEYLGVLRAFVRHHGADTSGTDNDNFCHLFICFV